jgi:hypothetical protein
MTGSQYELGIARRLLENPGQNEHDGKAEHEQRGDQSYRPPW